MVRTFSTYICICFYLYYMERKPTSAVVTAICRLYLISFIGVNFEEGNETRKKIGNVWLLNQIEKWSEKSSFLVHTAVLERARNWGVAENFLNKRFLVRVFDYIYLNVGFFDRVLKIFVVYICFMSIWMFSAFCWFLGKF